MRLGWAEHATQQLIGEAQPNLRKCAQKWLQKKSIMHSTLRNGTGKKSASDSGRQRRMQLMRATFLLLHQQEGFSTTEAPASS